MKFLISLIAIATIILTACSVSVAQDLSDIDRDTKALELFLQDKKDHKTHCPRLKWSQPKIGVYKTKLKTQLPKKCRK